MRDLRLYILMRKDLQSMVPGRCMAQASHASNALVHEHGNHALVKEWQRQTEQGFGTTIVLASCKEQIDAIFQLRGLTNWPLKGRVIDPDYCIRVTREVASFIPVSRKFRKVAGSEDNDFVTYTRSEVTCAYILGEKGFLYPFVGHLSLY